MEPLKAKVTPYAFRARVILFSDLQICCKAYKNIDVMKLWSLIFSFRFNYHSEILFHIFIQFQYPDFEHNESDIMDHLHISK